MILVELLRTFRPHQSVKNLFVLAPLVFAEHLADPTDLGRAGAAFVLFWLLSGCVYTLNDIVDVDSDRRHPVKRHRPIASGRLPLPAARLGLAILLVATIALCFVMSAEFAAIGLAYFTLNVGYSLALKHVPFLDILCIATGFVLRILGGAVAIAVPISAWLGLCTFLVASYVGLGKRKHEMLSSGDAGSSQRRVLERYEVAHIRHAMGLLALATMAAYAAYALVGETHASFSPRQFVWTLPFVAFGLYRFNVLTGRAEDGRSPSDLMLRDPLFVANMALWTSAIVFIIYLL